MLSEPEKFCDIVNSQYFVAKLRVRNGQNKLLWWQLKETYIQALQSNLRKNVGSFLNFIFNFGSKYCHVLPGTIFKYLHRYIVTHHLAKKKIVCLSSTTFSVGQGFFLLFFFSFLVFTQNLGRSVGKTF